MDQQKKHRKVLRAAFTKSANELDKLLSEEVALQQVQVAWEVLLQKHENLLIANREIYDTLLQENISEEDLMLEIDCCEGYEKKFIDLRITYGNRQKHVDIGLDEDDRRSRASLAVSKSTLGPVPGAQSENNGGANPESSTMSRLESLMSFVKSEVENEERIFLAAEGFGLNSDMLTIENRKNTIFRPPKRKPSNFEMMIDFIKAFLSMSSIGGFSHITQKNRHPIERFIWFVLVAAAVYGAVILSTLTLTSLSLWHRLSFGQRPARAKIPGDLTHVDVCGPMPESSLDGSSYILAINDDFSKYRTVFFSKEKSDIPNKLACFFKGAEVVGYAVEEMISNNKREFRNKEIEKITDEFGVHH
ncbi:hypothetical protein JTB14_010983 [Gonioctena quinquepunctata]|nr:hypothetical protein JTB14_010983 [Gonioctena quinquepunctata]